MMDNGKVLPPAEIETKGIKTRIKSDNWKFRLLQFLTEELPDVRGGIGPILDIFKDTVARIAEEIVTISGVSGCTVQTIPNVEDARTVDQKDQEPPNQSRLKSRVRDFSVNPDIRNLFLLQLDLNSGNPGPEILIRFKTHTKIEASIGIGLAKKIKPEPPGFKRKRNIQLVVGSGIIQHSYVADPIAIDINDFDSASHRLIETITPAVAICDDNTPENFNIPRIFAQYGPDTFLSRNFNKMGIVQGVAMFVAYITMAILGQYIDTDLPWYVDLGLVIAPAVGINFISGAKVVITTNNQVRAQHVYALEMVDKAKFKTSHLGTKVEKVAIIGPDGPLTAGDLSPTNGDEGGELSLTNDDNEGGMSLK